MRANLACFPRCTELVFPYPLHIGSKDVADQTEVADLQTSLRTVGVLQSTEKITDGVYDIATYRAVGRLQYFASNIPGVVDASNAFIPRRLTPLVVDGWASSQLVSFLNMMKANALSVTGSLVSVNFSDLPDFSRIYPSRGFQALLGGNNQLAVCDRSFVDVLKGMNKLATDNKIYVFVNQLFRAEGVAVRGAVVQPAGHSAHKLGRAIDLQLGNDWNAQGGNPQPAVNMKNAAKGSAFEKFRECAKSTLRCRYGGDFKDVDPPHFDQQILPTSSELWGFMYFFNQLQFQQSRINEAAIPYYK